MESVTLQFRAAVVVACVLCAAATAIVAHWYLRELGFRLFALRVGPQRISVFARGTAALLGGAAGLGMLHDFLSAGSCPRV
jgi:hypothetical protein